MMKRILNWLGLTPRGVLKIVLGCSIMAFTIVNIHLPSKITEGGVLGFTIFLYKIFGLHPSIVSPILDFSCFALAFSIFGKGFLKKTAVATASFSLAYSIFLGIGPVLPSLYDFPLLAALFGGLGIGLGCGLVISQGGAVGGDDALAFLIARNRKIDISRAYLLSDVVVLTLSVVYIPVVRLLFSLLTTIVSSFLIGQFEVKVPKKAPAKALEAKA